jgi:hypothetical protein
VAGSQPGPVWPTNAAGETYGSALPAVRLGLPRSEFPDLISAGLRDGKRGYVRRTELDVASGMPGIVAQTPGEKAAAQAQAQAAGERTLVPVYEQDGVTVIGTFVVGSAEPPNLPGQRR